MYAPWSRMELDFIALEKEYSEEIEKKVENLHLTNFISHEVVCLAAIVLTYMDMESLGGSHPSESAVSSQPVISFVYIGKIFLAIIFIFALGAVFTLALENLPRLILFINSSM
ncbi:hypothetical protein CK203_036790 [Vitis vinifera]|uniref:Uncharacterized protein n=1 Tax=Vitis vinifera TaxID=29760 RepID=A0A438I0S7_VITVI|nr:hypothetical protein CK203_036790 [Vitis vinifera]